MKILLRLLLSLGLAAALLGALAVWVGVEWDEVRGAFSKLSLEVLSSALAVHASIYVFRAWRFRLLVPKEDRPPFLGTLAVSAAHNLAAYVLPAKTGEATFVVYANRALGLPLAPGAASLLVSRLLDLIGLALLLGTACLGADSLALEGQAMPTWVRALGLVLLAAGSAFAILLWRGERLAPLFSFAVRLCGLDRTKWGPKLRSLGGRTVEAVRASRSGPGFVPAIFLTLPIWLGIFLFYAVLARGFGLPDSISLAQATFGSGLAVVANLAPINGLAGFGTQEAGWVVGFHSLGVSRDLAFSTGVGAHLVQLFDVALFGLLGHLAMGLFKPKAAPTA
ncbi:MAG: lysylphosphatidylglycerol synthase transmembrane domain-containing protein [Planctomycetota bacterium]